MQLPTSKASTRTTNFSRSKTTRSRASRFRVVDLPCLTKYFEFKREEARVLQDLKTVCQSPKDGVLAVRGGQGVGKTSMLAHIFGNENNYRFFVAECKFDLAFWIDCRNADAEAVKRRLIQLGRQVFSSDPFAQFYELKQMIDYLAEKHRRRVLVVLDSVNDFKILETLRSEFPLLLAAVILNADVEIPSKMPENLVQKVTNIEPLPDEQVAEVFASTYDLKNSIKDEHLKELSRHCCGHHLLISLLAARFNDSKDPNGEMKQQLAYIRSFNNPDALSLVRILFEQNLRRMDPILHRNYHAFLLFEPGEPVSLEDLEILWGFSGDRDAKERALQFCSFFEKKCLIRRVNLLGDSKPLTKPDSGYYFILHKYLHDIVVEHSKQFYGDINTVSNYLNKIRLKIASGAACTDGANVKAAVDICSQTLRQQRRHLVERIFNVLEPGDLAKLMGGKSEHSQRKTLLHLIYETSWPDDIEPINHSYRLICRILSKLKQTSVDLRQLIVERDDNEDNSLLKSIFRDSQETSNFKHDRKALMRFVEKYQHDYTEQVWYDRLAAQKDSVVIAILRNDLKALRELIFSPKNETLNFNNYAIASARLGKIDAVKIICEKIGSAQLLQIIDGEGQTVVSRAATNGHLDLLNYLVLQKYDVIRWSHAVCGKTLLMSAASHGHLATVRYLGELLDEESIAAQMEAGFGSFTALALAAKNGHTETVRYLYERYPNAVKFGHNDTGSAMVLAAEGGHSETVQLLSDLMPELIHQGVLNSALEHGHIETAKVLLAKRPSLAVVQQPGGWTPLMYAAASCDLEGVQFIYEKNRDAIRLTDTSGWTPLMVAVNRNKLDVVMFLYNKWPDAIRLQDISGYTALAEAAGCSGSLHMVQFLYDKYPDGVEVLNNNGESAFMRAVLSDNSNVDMLAFLFDKYRDAVALRNKYSVTPLMNAAFKCNLEACRFIYETFPLCASWRDENGKTALHYAKAAMPLDKTKQQKVTEYLATKIKDDDDENGYQ